MLKTQALARGLCLVLMKPLAWPFSITLLHLKLGVWCGFFFFWTLFVFLIRALNHVCGCEHFLNASTLPSLNIFLIVGGAWGLFSEFFPVYPTQYFWSGSFLAHCDNCRMYTVLLLLYIFKVAFDREKICAAFTALLFGSAAVEVLSHFYRPS